MLNTFLSYIDIINIRYVEIVSVIIALFNCILGMRQKVLTWPVNIFIILMNLIVYYKAMLYDKCFINLISILFSIYGWYKWMHGKDNNKELQVTKLGNKLFLLCVTLSLFLVPLIKSGLQYIGSDSLVLSSFRTSLWFIAMFLTANKKLESYIIWGLVNLFSMVICYYKGLYLFSIKYSIYFFLSIYGYIMWRRSYLKDNISKM